MTTINTHTNEHVFLGFTIENRFLHIAGMHRVHFSDDKCRWLRLSTVFYVNRYDCSYIIFSLTVKSDQKDFVIIFKLIKSGPTF